ncbi:carbohydrate ABC transporter permease [Agrobacterium sp. S2]|nr:carbohydrate ABC transporter permease [Agrobacterium sp. S2]
MVNTVVLLGVVAATLFPFLMIVARSFSSDTAIRAGQVGIVPVGFNITTYQLVMSDSMFWTNYRNTVVYTVVATAIAIVLTTCYAYVLSRRDLPGKSVLIGIAVVTMFFNGGLIPNYVLISGLGLKNTLWAIVLPNAISVFNLLVMKSFFENQPVELEEAAQIDGLSTYGIFLRIVIPLSKAVLATMILFYSVTFWNSWFAAFLYMDRSELFPVTVYLRNLIAGATSASSTGAAAGDVAQVSAKHPGRDDGAHGHPDPVRLPLRAAVLRLRRDARLRQGVNDGTRTTRRPRNFDEERNRHDDP